MLAGARANFVAHVFEPDPETGKRTIQLIISKNDPQVADLLADVDKVMKSAFPGINDGLASPFHDGDIKRSDRPEYKSCYYCEAKTGKNVPVVDRSRNPVTEDMGLLKNGTIVNAGISLYPYTHGRNKGVGVGLEALQIWEQSEAASFDINQFPVDISDVDDDDIPF